MQLAAVQRQARQNWAKLTDEDITRINGRRDELATAEERYGFAKAEAEREIGAWVSRSAMRTRRLQLT